MITRRSWFTYGTLLAIWLALLGWQVVEHQRVRHAVQLKLVEETKNISNTLGVFMRSQSFFGFISRRRLESALNELVKPGELHPLAVEVVNLDYERVASAGQSNQLPRGQVAGGVYWDGKARTLTLQNLVDLGDIGTNVVMSPSDFPNRPARRSDTNEPPPGFDPGRGPRSEPGREGGPPPPPPENEGGAAPAIQIAATESNLLSSNSAGTNGEPRRRSRRGDPERPFERPPWMSEADYQSILQKKGVHGFTIVMSTLSLIPPLVSDLWLRAVIVLLGTTALAAYALAWRNAARTSDLQIRLVRASELNSHLKEMNLAAAGLAHETRNPLNIVRGLAQMISRREDSPPEIREKSRQILEETDRVTAQLNGFINYSRPREVHRAPTSLNSVASEVVRALNYDVEEKKVEMEVVAEPLTIEADEQLLRQALFNLVLNAVQAVPDQGRIEIRAGRQNHNGAFLEIADNGPGVAPENRSEIFKPYFTTHADGTGLGLAVVQQIVLAHGWEIDCAPNQPRGAVFRINHLKLAG